MYGITDYLFVDTELNNLGEFGFRSLEAAENKCVELMKKNKKVVLCYELVCTADPLEYTQVLLQAGDKHG